MIFFRRKPDTLRLPPSVGTRRIYAIGDIHGRADLLDKLLAMIEADAAGAPGLAKQIIFVGDYVDRGMESKAVLDRLLLPMPGGIPPVFLKGNHEAAMLQFMDGDLQTGADWLGFGGRETLFSYGIKVGFTPGPAALEDVRKKLSEALPQAHRDFLNRLQMSVTVGGYHFVHAGIRPGVPLESQDPQDLMWIREDFLFSQQDHGKVIVHGHSISAGPDIRDNRIGIDTGAFATAHLTCLVLEGEQQRFLAT